MPGVSGDWRPQVGWAGKTETRIVVARLWRTGDADLYCFPEEGNRRNLNSAADKRVAAPRGRAMIAMAGMGAIADGHLRTGMGSRRGERARPRRCERYDDDKRRDKKA
jgi:hypothetical protein